MIQSLIDAARIADSVNSGTFDRGSVANQAARLQQLREAKRVLDGFPPVFAVGEKTSDGVKVYHVDRLPERIEAEVSSLCERAANSGARILIPRRAPVGQETVATTLANAAREWFTTPGHPVDADTLSRWIKSGFIAARREHPTARKWYFQLSQVRDRNPAAAASASPVVRR